MALVLDDRVQETTTTTGTGTLTLAGATIGYQSFAAIGNANTTYYNITDGTNWEVGIGTYTSSGTTLSRNKVLSSSNSGSLVNFPVGSKNVFCTYPASKALYTDIPNTFGFKNRFINGLMQIAQRATSGTSGSSVPTTSPTYPSVDRWYAYATGATVTVARVAGSNSNQYNLQVTGSGSVTAVGVGQRIEQSNCYDMAGSTATLSVNISNSLLTTVAWTANYATSSDTWSAKTQIATGTFTVTSTLTNYTANISIPAAATTGIEILFTVGAQTSGTWVIGNAQLEKGSAATTFDYRSYTNEFSLCQRYCYKLISTGANIFLSAGCFATATNVGFFHGNMPVEMRATPTLTLEAAANTYAVYNTNSGTYTQLSTFTLNGVSSRNFYLLQFTTSTNPGVVGITTYLTNTSGAFGALLISEL
jgi:hypothetical protein